MYFVLEKPLVSYAGAPMHPKSGKINFIGIRRILARPLQK
jgi:hypothetical protein